MHRQSVRVATALGAGGSARCHDPAAHLALQQSARTPSPDHQLPPRIATGAARPSLRQRSVRQQGASSGSFTKAGSGPTLECQAPNGTSVQSGTPRGSGCIPALRGVKRTPAGWRAACRSRRSEGPAWACEPRSGECLRGRHDDRTTVQDGAERSFSCGTEGRRFKSSRPGRHWKKASPSWLVSGSDLPNRS
jgi:hypothetical protein